MKFIEESPKERALRIAVGYGGFDGAHHKDWCIDQIVRALTECPIVTGTATDYNGLDYEYEDQGESEEYLKLVAEAKNGDDGPDTYEWNEGTPP